LRVFEVDHPATQTWKRKRLAEIGLNIPASLTFVPVDLKHQGLSSALVSVGFKPDRPAFFHWLGVVPCLPREVITSTLRFIASYRAQRSYSIRNLSEAIGKLAGHILLASPHVLLRRVNLG
jgi:methyltransferase (TIGR00027 family)